MAPNPDPLFDLHPEATLVDRPYAFSAMVQAYVDDDDVRVTPVPDALRGVSLLHLACEPTQYGFMCSREPAAEVTAPVEGARLAEASDFEDDITQAESTGVVFLDPAELTRPRPGFVPKSLPPCEVTKTYYGQPTPEPAPAATPREHEVTPQRWLSTLITPRSEVLPSETYILPRTLAEVNVPPLRIYVIFGLGLGAVAMALMRIIFA